MCVNTKDILRVVEGHSSSVTAQSVFHLPIRELLLSSCVGLPHAVNVLLPVTARHVMLAETFTEEMQRIRRGCSPLPMWAIILACRLYPPRALHACLSSEHVTLTTYGMNERAIPVCLAYIRHELCKIPTFLATVKAEQVHLGRVTLSLAKTTKATFQFLPSKRSQGS
jgi:hypothetical protein